MSEKKDPTSMANVTSDEITLALLRTHDLDRKDFITGLKKTIKAKNIRVNRYTLKEVSDGYMLKVTIEKFLGGKSMGTRVIKGYLSEKVKDELMVLLRAIPRKSYTDTRDGSSRERPEEIVRKFVEAPTDLDLKTLWNTEEK